jgi:hypothetical protein
MKIDKRNIALIFFISAVLFICIYLLLFNSTFTPVGNRIKDQSGMKVALHVAKDSTQNNDTLTIREIKNPGADIPRNRGFETEIHRPKGPDKPEGAGKKAGAVKITSNRRY